jgi:RND family efflux transporter MFP subunit
LRAEEELLAAQRLRQAEPGGDAGAAPSHSLGAQVTQAARQRLLLLGVHGADIDRVLAQGKAERLIAVRAPAAGTVTSRQVAVGTQATPETMLFQLTDLGQVWVSATVPSADVSLLPKGTRGRFTSRENDRSYDVDAVLVEPRVASDTRTVRVRFIAKNPDAALLPGAIGDVTVGLVAQEYIVVPRDAVIDVGSVQYVFVERSAGLFAPRVVHVGPLLGEDRAILRGLDGGERVVARGAFVLDSESRLQAALAPVVPAAPDAMESP